MKTILDMLTNSPIRPTIPAVDMDRAKRFYETMLGLRFLSNSSDGTSGVAIFECDKGTTVELYQHGPSKADHTVATFEGTILKMRLIY